ncbi:6-phosphofructokinase 1 [Enhydrobacter aerosaccus]|uniref:6-phosphofructokinase n=1 Tax=Enhydrobacter aerosaccus TaxID=225324 RepID=A0A1T4T0U6_9HYPH|nr:ATP-dependent 6-phosphofructokinase [Enhydrobacter aerosaccus]SKA33788.1 6-phosphofructokinase 1 [Enhydrobacter aerosaccus]
MSKRIGILTSGGDCAGLNATIRAVALRAHHGHGWQTVGIHRGTLGLLSRPVAAEPLDPGRLDAALARQGGTFLGSTNRGNPFAFPMEDGSLADRSAEMVEGLRGLQLDGLIGVGGDGSLAILRRLLEPIDLPFIGVPKTIDNDVHRTERAVGYTTAVAIATEAVDRLHPTGASHDRIMVLEVMGRDAGHIAMAAAIAGGADVVLIPEVPWRLSSVVDHIAKLRRTARTSALVVVAEAAGHAEVGTRVPEKSADQSIGERLAHRLTVATGAESRATVLGHVQRGAMPTAEDRLLASALGVHAVDLLAEGKADRMVGWWNRTVIDVPLDKVVGRSRTLDVDGTMIRTARALGICLGDA